MFTYEYECDRCRFRVLGLWGASGYYESTSGDRIPALCSPAWCEACHTIVSAERLLAPAFLQSELIRLSEEGPDDDDRTLAQEFGQPIDEFCSGRVETWNRYLRFFSDRISANRCVECGSTAIRFLETDEGKMPDAFEHPRCGGQLKLREFAHGIPAKPFVLDGEGTRIS
jgi:hypothetical protein